MNVNLDNDQLIDEFKFDFKINHIEINDNNIFISSGNQGINIYDF